ncbi:ubiquinone biosynthesis O-methyltransferase [Clavulina sp. PMI_390]|nr:ubiquinone biosynthesis O-methyltransferase [Clavulina sp. PMI_390]
MQSRFARRAAFAFGRSRPLTRLQPHGCRHATASSSSTVNPDEIEFFSKLSSQWWDERGEFAMLHRMNPARVSFVRDKIRETGLEESSSQPPRTKALSGLDVLDIGCGGGLLSECLSRLGASSTLGIDASSSNIEIAKIHSQLDRRLAGVLSYENVTSTDLVESGRVFDVVCSMEVLEHVDNPNAFLHSCANLVKPGGHLFLSTISRTPLAYLTNIFAAEHLLGIVSKGTHTYSKFIQSSELVDFFSTEVPWISTIYSGVPSRLEAEVRSMTFNPIDGRWSMAARGMEPPSQLESNYLFWVRRPNLGSEDVSTR